MIVLIMGPAGSGKGTQAEFIAKKLNLYNFSSGDLFREEEKKDTERGNLIRSLIDKGNLVPDEITIEMVGEVIEKNPNIIIDGTPRNVNQAKIFKEKYGFDLVVLLEVGEEEVIKRMKKRRVCSTTGKTFIVDKITDKDIEECKAAGGEIVEREDDTNEDFIKQRLKIFHERTEPVIKYCEDNNIKVLRINGEQSIEDVRKEIESKLDKLSS